MDTLNEQIINFHASTEQSTQMLNKAALERSLRKLHMRDILYYAVAPVFPMCGLYLVGSSLNGFGKDSSDMDLTLMITNRDIDQQSDAVVVLDSLMRTLESALPDQTLESQQLILAKVPILRLKLTPKYYSLTVDLNVNNSVAIRNTHLLCYYSSFDWRVRPLVLVVKEWAKRRGINDANRSSFTSYSLVLMVIHYLQCGIQPPVLPSLQKVYPDRFKLANDVRSLNIVTPLQPRPETLWNFDDTHSLGELLLGFLHYYAFNYDSDAISIRLGCKTGRSIVANNFSPYNNLSQWHCICIEEPFTYSNTAYAVYDIRIFEAIKQAFITGYRKLDEHKDLTKLFLGDSGVAESDASARHLHCTDAARNASVPVRCGDSAIIKTPLFLGSCHDCGNIEEGWELLVREIDD